jgi:hypothetical protein
VAGTGKLLVQQLSGTGQVLSTTSLSSGAFGTAYGPLNGLLVAAPGAAQVRVVLLGGLGGGAFDDIRLWEE